MFSNLKKRQNCVFLKRAQNWSKISSQEFSRLLILNLKSNLQIESDSYMTDQFLEKSMNRRQIESLMYFWGVFAILGCFLRLGKNCDGPIRMSDQEEKLLQKTYFKKAYRAFFVWLCSTRNSGRCEQDWTFLPATI